MQDGNAGILAVISGPSGSGKTTICRELARHERVDFSISATTRPRRGREVEGRDYHFIDSVDRFRELAGAGRFLEWAEYNGNLYGTPREQVDLAKRRGRVVILEIEVQGAAKLREAGEEGVYIFIEPPSMEVLEERLRGRGTESDGEVRKRLDIARAEWDRARNSAIYDHFVTNDRLDLALTRVHQLLGLAARED